MEIKSYSIATPFFNKKQKLYGIAVSSLSKLQKSYTLALKLLSPFVHASDNYPIKLSPFSRYKAVVVENEETTANRIVKVESSLDKYLIDGLKVRNDIEIEIDTFVDAVVPRDIEINIDTLLDMKVPNEFDITIHELYDLQRLRELLIDINTIDNGEINRVDYSAIIKGEYISNRLDEKEIIIRQMLDFKEVSKEISIDIAQGYLTIRHDTFDMAILEDEQALRLVRLIYGETIYQELANVKEKVFDAYMRYIEEYEKVEKILDGIYLEFHAFDDMGYETFMPELDIFDRVVLEEKISLLESYNYEYIVPELDGSFINIHEGSRKLIQAESSYVERDIAQLVKQVEAIYIEQELDFDRVTPNLISTDLPIEYTERKTEELLSSYISIDELNRVEDELEVRLFDTQKFDRLMEYLSIYDSALQESIKNTERESVLLNIEEKAERDMVYASSIDNGIQYFSRESEHLAILPEWINFDRVVKELEGRYMQMELFNSMGIPVYLHEFDVFSRQELQFDGSMLYEEEFERIIEEIYSVYEHRPEEAVKQTEYISVEDLIESSIKYNDEFITFLHEVDKGSRQDEFDTSIHIFHESDKQRERVTIIEESKLVERDNVIDNSVILEMFEDGERILDKNSLMFDIFDSYKDLYVLSTLIEPTESVHDNENLAQIIDIIDSSDATQIFADLIIDEVLDFQLRTQTEGIFANVIEYEDSSFVSSTEALHIHIDELAPADHIYLDRFEAVLVNDIDWASKDKLYEAGFTLEFTNSDKSAYLMYRHELDQFNRDSNKAVDLVFDRFTDSLLNNELYSEMLELHALERSSNMLGIDVYNLESVNRATQQLEVGNIELFEYDRVTNQIISSYIELDGFGRFTETHITMSPDIHEHTIRAHEMFTEMYQLDESTIGTDEFNIVIDHTLEYNIGKDTFEIIVDEYANFERIDEFKSDIQEILAFHRLDEMEVHLDVFDEFTRIEKLATIDEYHTFERNKVLSALSEEILWGLYDDRSYIWLWHSRPYWWYTWNWYKTK
jgi:hypothetical protein